MRRKNRSFDNYFGAKIARGGEIRARFVCGEPAVRFANPKTGIETFVCGADSKQIIRTYGMGSTLPDMTAIPRNIEYLKMLMENF